MQRAGEVRIGVSGWTYPPWRGQFYPAGLPQRLELAHAASIFRSIEVNGTFYGLQKPTTFARWAAETPDDFVFAVKGPRFITHDQRLAEPAGPLANFLASGVLRLGPKLGPILWQLPPSLPFEPHRLETFLALLPHTTANAAAFAARHEPRMNGSTWIETDADRPLRHALEIRHDSYRAPAFIALLRRHRVALVCADTVDWPRLMDRTADFAYCRLHGSRELYRSGYGPDELARWAARVTAWAAGIAMEDGAFAGPPGGEAMPSDVFVYFDNTEKLRAPDDAQVLARLVADAGPGTAHT
ncbi:uncharacterized protein YecE (DUF72 family) [Stella humosa]|uniref:Uncharacterized protein YecE (DUF72 family) n=1 Tax=Stella humosa TaxID=94 RepID=A0A3N1KU06_9PROT|nr:DUF72 domain-containing protein [Stella humosa]ROP84061.1 uncharacterized protein YecE (DUF72 family) [Stella humosa]BBK33572.1 hypothetical protein STHU_42060 [Stella humosa]